MQRFLMGSILAAFVAGLLGGESIATAQEKGKKKADPEAIFKRLDADKDGKLTLTEYKGKRKEKAAAAAEKRFKAADKNSDDALDLDEFKASLTKKKKKKK